MPGGRPKVVGIHLLTLPWIPTLGQRTLGVLPSARHENVYDRRPLVKTILDHLLVLCPLGSYPQVGPTKEIRSRIERTLDELEKGRCLHRFDPLGGSPLL